MYKKELNNGGVLYTYQKEGKYMDPLSVNATLSQMDGVAILIQGRGSILNSAMINSMTEDEIEYLIAALLDIKDNNF